MPYTTDHIIYYLQPCGEGSGYRQAQCQRIGENWHVSAPQGEESPCALICEERDPEGIVLRRFEARASVLDGVECASPEPRASAICIQDVCTVVGCDNIINSSARLDQCGQCNGGNQACQVYSGSIPFNFVTIGKILKAANHSSQLNITRFAFVKYCLFHSKLRMNWSSASLPFLGRPYFTHHAAFHYCKHVNNYCICLNLYLALIPVSLLSSGPK